MCFCPNVSGIRKPNPAAYFVATESLGVAPKNCVFGNDLKRSVTAVQFVGMHGVRYLPGGEEALREFLFSARINPAEAGPDRSSLIRNLEHLDGIAF